MSAGKRNIFILGGMWFAGMIAMAVGLAPIMFPDGRAVGTLDLRVPTNFVAVQAGEGDVILTRTSFEADVDGDLLESILFGGTLRIVARGPETLEATCALYTGSAYSSNTSERYGELTGIPNDCRIRIPKAGTYQISADNPFANHLIEDERGNRYPLPLRRAQLEVRIARAERPR